MSYEVKTPSLRAVETAMLSVMTGAIDGTVEPKQGALACNAAGRVTKAVDVDIRARLNAAAIARSESAATKLSAPQEQNPISRVA
jgi:hypothetical protein